MRSTSGSLASQRQWDDSPVPRCRHRPTGHWSMREAEFSRLFTTYSPVLVRQLKRQYRELAGEVEDIVQDAFRKLWERCGEGGSSGPTECPDVPEAWVSRSATNAMIDVWRSAKADHERGRVSERRPLAEILAAFKPASAESEATDAEVTRRRAQLLHSMRDCLDSMPPHERTLLVLKYIDGLSYSEIADRTGYSKGSLGTLLLRARRSLHAHLIDSAAVTRQ